MYLPTIGACLAFIPTLDHPDMFGVNPEVAHEHMAGLNFLHGVARRWEAGKLFHIDLNDQEFGRYDQDFRFGVRGPSSTRSSSSSCWRTPATTGRATSTRTPTAPRTTRACGTSRPGACGRTWPSPSGSPLRRSARSARGPRGGGRPGPRRATVDGSSNADTLKAEADGLDALAVRGYANERLDQLLVDVLLGVR